MRRILKVVVACAAIVALAWWVARLNGRVDFDVGPYTVEGGDSIAVVALLLAFVVFYGLFRLLSMVLRLHKFHAIWRGGRRRRAGELAVTRALVALAAGEKSDARREAGRARQYLGDTPQTLLLAAEAGRLAGRDDEAKAALTALAARHDSAFLGLRGLLAVAVAKQDWAEAAAIARKAEAAHPGAAWLRQERARLAIRAGHWAEALGLSGPEAPRAALAVGAARAETNPDAAEKLARQALKHDPAFVPAILTYASRLRARGQEKKAQGVLADGWVRSPHPDIAALALEPVTDKLARTAAAQKLTVRLPDHPETHLLLARCDLDAGILGNARRHLDAAQAAGCDRRIMWLMRAELEEDARGDTEEGRMAQRDALRRAAAADPDPEWRCDSCHTPQPAWRPACPVCQTPGSLHWGAGAASVAAGTAIAMRAA